MAETKRPPIRVLVVDDDPDILVAYRQVLDESVPSNDRAAIDACAPGCLRQATPRPRVAPASTFEAIVCNGAEAAVAKVKEACEAGNPISVAFPRHAHAARTRRGMGRGAHSALDPEIEIVICTAYSDVDPSEIGRRVPPADRLFYLQKPFHPHEVRQLALALGEKRQSAQAAREGPDRLRYADGSAEPRALHRTPQGAVAVARGTATGWQSCTSISTTSGASTTRSDSSPETSCCASSPSSCGIRAPRRPRHPYARDTPISHDVARIGGDQFMVLLHAIAESQGCGSRRRATHAPVVAATPLANRTLTVTASVGIAVFPNDSDDGDALLRHAGIAMNGARRLGPGHYAFFDEAMHAGAQTRIKLEALLQTALAKDEFSLHYQPQFDLSTGKISGMEALLRWNSAELGSMPPDQFIPVAEEIGVILPIGEWVLRTACKQARIWQQNGLPNMRIAVNVVSAVHATEFRDDRRRVLEETGLPAHTLELEITSRCS